MNESRALRSGAAVMMAAVITAALLLLSWPSTVAADAAAPFDRWYTVLLGEQPAGWMHSTLTQPKKDGPLISRQEMQITISRGGRALTLSFGSEFQETAEGKPIVASSHQALGAMRVDQTMKFLDGGIELITGQGGAQRSSKAPKPQVDWLTPVQASRYVEKQLASGAQEITLHTIDPAVGPRPIELHMTLKGKENVQVLGKVVPAIVWDSQVSALPGVVSREYVDEAGQTIKSTVEALPGVKMTIVASDEALAKAQVNPPELLASTLIKPNKPINNPRQTRTAVYELQIIGRGEGKPVAKPDANAEGKGKAGKELPSTGFQRVVWGDEQTARVVVDLTSPVAPGTDLPTANNRRATTVLNSDDPKVKELVTRALGDGAAKLSPPQKAERLRQFVHRFIKTKDLSVGFATASEVARTAEGDCSEHGVLLAALLRGAGIPSRTVSGVLYVDSFIGQQGVFGYHMWTQAWLGGGPDGAGGARWVDLDATLGDTPFDATHIILGTSDMADDAMVNDMMAMAPLIGRLKIRVIEADGGK